MLIKIYGDRHVEIDTLMNSDRKCVMRSDGLSRTLRIYIRVHSLKVIQAHVTRQYR